MAAPRVLITRSPHQASTLADQLRACGAEPVLIPTIELTEPTSFAALDAALAHLDRFHWLLFTSTNAVEAFVKRAASSAEKRVPQDLGSGAGSSPSEKREDVRLPPNGSTQTISVPPDLKIAAIGSATARALETAGLPVHLLPPKAVAESLAEQLLPHALQPDGSPTRFLLLRAEIARELLPEALRAAGAEVTIAPAYRNVVPSDSIAAVQRLFSARDLWPAAITFTSSSTATNLIALLEAANLSLPEQILRISIGPITSQTLRDHHLPPHAEAAESNLSGLVAAVAETLHLNKRN